MQIVSQPIDYSIDVINPQKAMLEGLQYRAMQEKYAAEQKEQEDFATAYSNFMSLEKPTTKDAALFMTKVPASMQERFKPLMQNISEEESKASLNFGLKVMNALESDPAVAINLLRERATAETNSGNQENASFFEQLAKTAEKDPGGAMKVSSLVLASIPGAKEALENIAKARGEQRAAEMAPLDKQLKQAEIYLKREQTIAERASQVPASIREAVGFGKLSKEDQEAFISLQRLKSPATNINIDNVDKTGQAELGKLIPGMYNKMLASANQYQKIERSKKNLDKIISGVGGETRLEIEKIANAMGFTGDKRLEATREYIQTAAQVALDAREKLEGQGSVSNFEYTALKKAVSFEQDLTPAEIKVVFKAIQEEAQRTYYNNKDLLERTTPRSEVAKLFYDSALSQSTEPPMPEFLKNKQNAGTKSAAPTTEAQPAGGFKYLGTE